MRAPPREVAVDRSLTSLAPKFRAAVEAILADVGDAKVAESTRTFARQTYLFGFGREYDDGRGIVTNANSALTSWHGYGLAVDIVHETKEWNAGDAWFRLMGDIAKSHGCSWGGDWHHPDMPHVQWGGCPASPNEEHRHYYEMGGVQAVWDDVGAL